jgi:hypothetical protein
LQTTALTVYDSAIFDPNWLFMAKPKSMHLYRVHHQGITSRASFFKVLHDDCIKKYTNSVETHTFDPIKVVDNAEAVCLVCNKEYDPVGAVKERAKRKKKVEEGTRRLQQAALSPAKHK